jgi:hypothetical protein
LRIVCFVSLYNVPPSTTQLQAHRAKADLKAAPDAAEKTDAKSCESDHFEETDTDTQEGASLDRATPGVGEGTASTLTNGTNSDTQEQTRLDRATPGNREGPASTPNDETDTDTQELTPVDSATPGIGEGAASTPSTPLVLATPGFAEGSSSVPSSGNNNNSMDDYDRFNSQGVPDAWPFSSSDFDLTCINVDDLNIRPAETTFIEITADDDNEQDDVYEIDPVTLKRVTHTDNNTDPPRLFGDVRTLTFRKVFLKIYIYAEFMCAFGLNAGGMALAHDAVERALPTSCLPGRA